MDFPEQAAPAELDNVQLKGGNKQAAPPALCEDGARFMLLIIYSSGVVAPACPALQRSVLLITN
ncbi:MAG: hypothetical protein JWO44_2511 [Bacteroidetes bacterium]|nr:hypothetical protein [Bacteroidota bacterium]